jgi:N6-adenosine-specific RNA methylase IME4
MNIFDSWGVDLLEEWIWLKITDQGEPMYPINGLWRKPYEILLVGKQRDLTSNFECSDTEKDRTEPTRRLIVGAADHHSMKPSLKALMERTLLQNVREYRALEVFARNLTAGWTAWGDEVIKFNWEGHWNFFTEDAA